MCDMEILNVSAYMASWVADSAKPPTVVPKSIAVREARKIQLRQERGDIAEDDIDSASPIIQTAMAGLDLMNEGNHQPQSTLNQVLRSYAEND